MDVQAESADPPPNESQPSGKIRKGFKLFGKRKPGNIFSIRNKGDGNKSPVNRSETSDGVSEAPAPESDQEQDKEKGQEVSQGDSEQTEDETLTEDAMLAAAPPRMSISSVSSAKSLGFLSLLRGSRRGTGDRRVHTVSQPTARQRRGLKGLFGNVKSRLKDKDDKEEAPPSPILKSSRANSVEIIKEDLTLTPKCKPRTVDSPDSQEYQPVYGTATHDGSSDTKTSKVTPSKVGKAGENVPPVPNSEPPLVTDDNSLSSLLADISSLLTFDSISGSGDIVADVEAEWGKASRAIDAVATNSKPSPVSSAPLKSSFSSQPTSTSPTAKSLTTSTMSSTSVTRTTFTKPPSTFESTKPPSVSSPSAKVEPALATTTTKLPTAPMTVTITSFSTAGVSSVLKTTPTTLNTFNATTSAPLKTSTAVVSAPLTTPAPRAPTKPVAEALSSLQSTTPVSKTAIVNTVPLGLSAQMSVVTDKHPPPVQVEPTSSLNPQKTNSYKPSQTEITVDEPKTKNNISTACTASAKPSVPITSVFSNMTTVSTSSSTPSSTFTAFSKPPFTSTFLDSNKTPPVVSDPRLSSTLATANKAQPNLASLPAHASSTDKSPPTIKSSVTSVSGDKASPPPTPISVTAARATASDSPAPSAQAKIAVSQSQTSPALTLTSASKELSHKLESSPCTTVCSSTPLSNITNKDLPDPVKPQPAPPKQPFVAFEVPLSKPADAKAPASSPPVTVIPAKVADAVTTTLSGPAQTPALLSKETSPPTLASALTSAPKTSPIPAQISVFETNSCPAHSTTITTLPATAIGSSEGQLPSKVKEIDQPSSDHLSATPDVKRSQAVPPKLKELPDESTEPVKDKKPASVKASGLSKIPVVGGGRVGKLPVRESQHANDEASRDPPTPVTETSPHFNSHDAASKDKLPSEASSPPSKNSQEENPQPQQAKVPTGSTRDSKIPVKHGPQSQTRDATRTRIPVSKVPVRRAGNKPTTAAGGSQIRK